MCGIAGALSLSEQPVTLSELQDMTAAIAHRGPDDDGFLIADGIGLGMRRLSIIDLKKGDQPIHNEDRSIWVVFNGEIYNFRELRSELEAKGHRFYTNTDTEVIVHLYEDYGWRCVEHMRGMFAFAVWDVRRQQLMLARDRLGVKPMYYAKVGGRFVFASELKALLQLPWIDRELDWTAVDHVLTFLCTPPESSIIQGVQKLLPAHVLCIDRTGQITQHKYWSLTFQPDYSLTEQDFTDRLFTLLEQSVRLRMISDVPVGAFLSGGIDSSTVVALMSGMTSSPVKTFSIGFAEPQWNELQYARMVAQQYGTDHHELIVEPNDVSFLEDLIWHLDEPLGDCSAIPTYLVSKLASAHVKVVLSGDGGDEMFAGYDKYASATDGGSRHIPLSIRRLCRFVGDILPDGTRGKNYVRHLGMEGAEQYLDSVTLFRTYQKLQLLTPAARERMRHSDPCKDKFALLESNVPWLSRLQLMDVNNYLPLDILTKVDRMSMAHSVEAREPLLDHKVVEFAATIPPQWQMKNGRTKHILKECVKPILPDAVINRTKKGFGVPLGPWFRGPLKSFVRDLLTSRSFQDRDIFDSHYVHRLLANHDSNRELDLHLWTLVSFELWCRTFLDGSNRNHRESEHALKKCMSVSAP